MLISVVKSQTIIMAAKPNCNIIKNDATIYVALDPDAEKKSLKLMLKLLQYDIEVKKINIFPYSDVAEMTREEFERRKAEAKPFTSDDFLYRQLISI